MVLLSAVTVSAALFTVTLVVLVLLPLSVAPLATVIVLPPARGAGNQQGPCIDGRGAGVGVRSGEGERTAPRLGETARPRDNAREGRAVAVRIKYAATAVEGD